MCRALFLARQRVRHACARDVQLCCARLSCTMHTPCTHAVTLQARIEREGGQILFWNGVRVMGVLAVSRAIGDHCLRPYVIAKPEVCVYGSIAHGAGSRVARRTMGAAADDDDA